MRLPRPSSRLSILHLTSIRGLSGANIDMILMCRVWTARYMLLGRTR